MDQATVEIAKKSACLRCGTPLEGGDLCKRCDEEITAPYCEQHGLPIGPSGLCEQCECEANAERCEEHGAILNSDGSCPECDEQWEVKEEPKAQPAAKASEPQSENSILEFPRHALVGSVGDFAKVLAKGSEVPEEFYFAAGLTVVGAMCGDRLKLTLAFDVEPRLYTVLHGESYSVKKSTAVKRTFAFFG